MLRLPRRHAIWILNRTGFPGGPNSWKKGSMETNKTIKPYPAELRERAVRLLAAAAPRAADGR
jgi:hypothetical protein